MDKEQFYKLIICHELVDRISPPTKQSRLLLMGTALVESNLEMIHQIGGPALGFFQMEPDTHEDIWNNWIKYRKTFFLNYKEPKTMVYDLVYAACMTRVHYLRVSEKIPETTKEMGDYWKKYYNTYKGRGKAIHFHKKLEVFLRKVKIS